MKHLAEDDLTAYQLGESVDAAAVRAHVEQCAQCAALSDSIAETLRVFSAEPVPQVNVDHAWQRMRGSLPAQKVPVRRGWWNRGPVLAASGVGAMVCVVLAALDYNVRPRDPAYGNQRPRLLTRQPAGDMAITNYLDSAERLLTEVNHTTGPLDESTRVQASTLLLTNAGYVQQAHAAGDLAEASLLERLGRVLTTLEHQPRQSSQDKGWHIRFEMGADGLLLDLRILQENDQRNDPHSKDPK